MLIDVVDFYFGIGVTLRVIGDSLLTIVGRINCDHCQGHASFVLKLLLVVVVVILDLAVADCDFSGVLVLQFLNGNVFFRFFAERFGCQVLLFQLAGKLFIRCSAVLLLFIYGGTNLVFARQKLFLLGPLEENFALNQTVQYLHPSLRQIVGRKLSLFPFRLLRYQSFNFRHHDLFAVDGSSDGGVCCAAARRTGGERESHDRAEG